MFGTIVECRLLQHRFRIRVVSLREGSLESEVHHHAAEEHEQYEFHVAVLLRASLLLQWYFLIIRRCLTPSILLRRISGRRLLLGSLAPIFIVTAHR